MLAPSGDIELYFDSTGAGAPVLLVMGLGMNATGWWRTVPVLARSHRVVAFDNRGMGRSGKPPGPYTMDELADDAVAVLDAAGEPAAHVYGISLGGMIAQHIALRHPDRVRGLVLGATTAGGELVAAADPVTLAFFFRRADMPPGRGRMGLGPVQLRAGHARPPRAAHRRGHRPAAALPRRARAVQGPARGGRRPRHERAARRDPRPDAHRPRRAGPHGAGRQRRAARGPHPRRAVKTYPGAGHLYTTDEPAADEDVAAFLASLA